MAKWLKLYVTYTYSTSPNLRHRTTWLNTDVPDWNLLFVTQYLTIELLHSKLKYGLFNRAISSTTYRLTIERTFAQNMPRVH